MPLNKKNFNLSRYYRRIIILLIGRFIESPNNVTLHILSIETGDSKSFDTVVKYHNMQGY